MAKSSGKSVTRAIVLSALMGALLIISKQIMSGLPNIEPVSFLIILYSLEFPKETPAGIAVFVLMQGILYGFGIWWFMYLYIWFILMAVTFLFRKIDHILFWAVISGLYGLAFGGLCSLIYITKPSYALAWWLAGLPYDAVHGIGNFLIMLVLYRPIRKAIQTAKKYMYKNG
ncbi:MAG: hypothetical protein LIO69_01265 [Oscillospiraceae bacterium]|nr:hypothetical protein [Oscillospiraceae bacterium]